MTALFLYDNNARCFERFEGSELPYLTYGRITMRGFLGQSDTDVAWTDLRLLKAYDALCEINAASVYVGAGFKRVGSGLCSGQSAHYAGLALHMGQGVSSVEREQLRILAAETTLFSYVEPSHLAPVWVHAEISAAPSCSLSRSYPNLSRGMSGVHVFVLQDALLCCGFHTALTGIFDAATERALLRFRESEGLMPSASADLPLWNRLIKKAKTAMREPDDFYST
jgi:hypothetical protein